MICLYSILFISGYIIFISLWTVYSFISLFIFLPDHVFRMFRPVLTCLKLHLLCFSESVKSQRPGVWINMEREIRNSAYWTTQELSHLHTYCQRWKVKRNWTQRFRHLGISTICSSYSLNACRDSVTRNPNLYYKGIIFVYQRELKVL